ncbi:hypothetical protein BH23ACT10_BH23ACT10_23520 [soil metagenome]
MAKWLRWLLIALFVYFVVAYPTDAAELTRRVVGGAVDLFTGAAQSVAAFLRAIV